MNKVLFIAGTALVAATALVTPKIIATQVEQPVVGLVNLLNQTPEYTASVAQFDTGWFSSRAIINVGLSPDMFATLFGEQPEEGLPLSVPLTLDITHGPVVLDDNGLIGAAGLTISYQGDELDKLTWDKAAPFFQISGVLGIGGSLTFSDQIPAFSFDDGASAVEFSGYRGQGKYQNDSVSHQGQVTRVTLNGPGAEVTLNDIRMDGTIFNNVMQIFATNDLNLDGGLSIANLVITDGEDQSNTSVDGIALRLNNKVADDTKLSDMNVSYMIKAIEASDFNLQDVEINMAVSQFSQQLFQEFQYVVDQTNMTGDPAPLMAFTQENLVEMLKGSPEMAITKIHAKLKDGQLDGNARAKINAIDAVPANILDHQFWRTKAELEAGLKIDESVATYIATEYIRNQMLMNGAVDEARLEEIATVAAERAPILIDNLIQQGMLIKHEQQYVLDFAMLDGKMMLNGTQLPF